MSTLKPAGSANANRFVPASRGHDEDSRAGAPDALSYVSTATLNAGNNGEIIAQRTVQTTTTRTETLGIAKPLNISAFTKKSSSRKLITAGEQGSHTGASIEEISDTSDASSLPRPRSDGSAPFITAPQASSDSLPKPSFRPAAQPVFAFAHSSNKKDVKSSINAQTIQPFAWAQPDTSGTASHLLASRTTIPINSNPSQTHLSQSGHSMGETEAKIREIDLLRMGNSNYSLAHVLNPDNSAVKDNSKKRRRTKDMHVDGDSADAGSLSHLDLHVPFDDSGVAFEGDNEEQDADSRGFKKQRIDHHNESSFSRSPSEAKGRPTGSSHPPVSLSPYEQYTNDHAYANVETQLPYDPYDALSYMMEHNDKLQAARQRWQDCTMDEWIRGAKELTAEFENLLDYVKDHMKRKIDMFASLHQSITNHSSLLDKREDKLKSVQGKLAKDAGNIMVGVGVEKSA